MTVLTLITIILMLIIISYEGNAKGATMIIIITVIILVIIVMVTIITLIIIMVVIVTARNIITAAISSSLSSYISSVAFGAIGAAQDATTITGDFVLRRGFPPAWTCCPNRIHKARKSEDRRSGRFLVSWTLPFLRIIIISTILLISR